MLMKSIGKYFDVEGSACVPCRCIKNRLQGHGCLCVARSSGRVARLYRSEVRSLQKITVRSKC